MLITFDLIQYNLYRLEITAENIFTAKNEILKLDKNLLNKNVVFVQLEAGHKEWSQNSPLQTDLELIEIEHLIDGEIQKSPMSCFELLEKNIAVDKFYYHILIAESNRYQDIIENSLLSRKTISMCDILKNSKTKTLIESGKYTVSSKEDDELHILEMIESSQSD